MHLDSFNNYNDSMFEKKAINYSAIQYATVFLQENLYDIWNGMDFVNCMDVNESLLILILEKCGAHVQGHLQGLYPVM